MSVHVSTERWHFRPLGDAAFLVLLAVLAWQGLYEVVGDVALTPPMATLLNQQLNFLLP